MTMPFDTIMMTSSIFCGASPIRWRNWPVDEVGDALDALMWVAILATLAAIDGVLVGALLAALAGLAMGK